MFWNYIVFLFKLIISSLIFAIPFTLICIILEKEFKILNKKKSFFLSLFILIYIISYIILLVTYYLPFIITGFPANTFWNTLITIVFNTLRLLFVNLIISGILLFFAFISTAIYEKLNENKKKKNKEHTQIFKLWVSISISAIIAYIIYLIFPKILSLIVYIIYF
jgi:hypothetical protein